MFLALSVLFTLLVSVSARAQLNGIYTRNDEVYNFHNNGTFDWIKTANQSTYGNGHYSVKGKKLELNFSKARLQFDMQLNESKPDDKCIVEIRIMYSNGQPTTGTTISLIQSNIRQYVNSIGVLKLELSNPVIEDKIVLDVNDRQSIPIPITLKGKETLLGIVIDETIQYKDNTSETPSFKMKRNKILLNKKVFKRALP